MFAPATDDAVAAPIGSRRRRREATHPRPPACTCASGAWDQRSQRGRFSYCALICTFEFGATLQRAFAGFTFDRFGNVWSTTQESSACPDAFTTVQPSPARTPWFVPALTVRRHGLRPISTTSAPMKFDGWKMVAIAYFP